MEPITTFGIACATLIPHAYKRGLEPRLDKAFNETLEKAQIAFGNNPYAIEIQDELLKILVQAFRQAAKSYCIEIKQLCQSHPEYKRDAAELTKFANRVGKYIKKFEGDITSDDRALLDEILPFLSGGAEYSPLAVTEDLTKNLITWLIGKEGQDLPEAARTLLIHQDTKTSVKSFGMLVIAHFQKALLNGDNPQAVVALELYYFSKIRDYIAGLQTTIDLDLKRPLDAISYELSSFALQAYDMWEKLDHVAQQTLNLTSDVGQLRQEVEQLAKQLNFIPLNDKNYRDLMMGSISALSFEYQGSDYIGREQAIAQLQAFLHSKESVCWWQISGDGGQGKSRLALHLLSLLEPNWRAGFISADDLAATDWRQIPFRHPTLIIIDYLSGKAKTAHFVKALQNLEIYQQNAEKKIRFLILDRVGFRWQRQSTDPVSWYDYVDEKVKNYIHNTAYAPAGNPATAQSLHLTDQDLSVQEMQKIMISYRHKQNAHCDRRAENRQYQELDQADLDMLISWMQEDIYNPDSKQFEKKKSKAWRPLFAMIFASLFEEIRTKNLTKSTEDPIYQALDHVYRLERQTYWRDQTGKDKKMSKQAVNLACLTTMIGSFDLETDFEELQQHSTSPENYYDGDDPRTILSDTLMVLGQHVRLTQDVEYLGKLWARQPDLLGEFMILFELKEAAKKGFGGDLNRIETLAQDAFQLKPAEFEAFLIRLSQDFGKYDVFKSLSKVNLRQIVGGDQIRLDPNYHSYHGLLCFLRLVPKEKIHTFFLNNNRFPLLYACHQGHVSCIEWLIKNEADVNQISLSGEGFPLLLAAQNGHANCVKLLLDEGAEVNQVYKEVGIFPLLQAAQEGHTNCVKLLLDEGAEVNQRNKVAGTFPLFLAAEHGHVDCVQLLLEKGAEANQVDKKSGFFPLLMASQNGHSDCVRLLLESDAEPNQVNKENDAFPLLMASQNGHVDCVQLLLEKGAEVNQIYKESGVFPLLMAAQNSHSNCIQLLLEEGADPWQEHEETGGSPVIISFEQKHTEIPQLFADHLNMSVDELYQEAGRRYQAWQAKNPQ